MCSNTGLAATCQCFGFLMRAWMLTYVTVHCGCMDTIRECTENSDRKIHCHISTEPGFSFRHYTNWPTPTIHSDYSVIWKCCQILWEDNISIPFSGLIQNEKQKFTWLIENKWQVPDHKICSIQIETFTKIKVCCFMWHLPWKLPLWTLLAKSMNWTNSSIVLTVTIFHKNIGRCMIFWIDCLLRRMTFKGSIQMRTSFSMWIPTKPLAHITLHHEYLRHVLNSLLKLFASYLMHVSPQILFQLLGKLHALCLYWNNLSYHPWMIFVLKCLPLLWWKYVNTWSSVNWKS